MRDIEWYTNEITRLTFVYKSYFKSDALTCFLKETTKIKKMVDSYNDTIKEIILNNEFLTDVLKEELKQAKNKQDANNLIKKYNKLIKINIKSIKYKEKIISKYNKELNKMDNRTKEYNKKVYLNRILNMINRYCIKLHQLKTNVLSI